MTNEVYIRHYKNISKVGFSQFVLKYFFFFLKKKIGKKKKKKENKQESENCIEYIFFLAVIIHMALSTNHE